MDNLLYGTAYYDEYMPYDRIDTDFSMMKRAGMNVIRIAESTWSTLEPTEGIYDFSHIDRMLSAALKYGMKVIIGTPTYAIPAWLVKKAPAILAVTHQGTERYGHRQNMDITHPVYLSHCEQIIRILLEHVKNHPAVIGYQLDNETKHYDTCSEQAQALFVEYLKKAFPDIQEFNREFGLDYWSNRVDSWDDFPDIRGTVNGSLAAEYEKFQRKLVTDFFAWQASLVSESKSPQQFITHNFDFAWKHYSYGLQPDCDQFASAPIMSIAGADIYHPSGADLTGLEITLCGNIIRGLKKTNYLLLETQAQGTLGRLPYPGQLRLQAYSHILNGANSVMYWHWHSIHNSLESYWKGILSHDLSANETYADCTVIGSEFQRIGTHLVNLKKKNKVAVMVNHLSLTGMKYFPTAPAEEIPDADYNTFLRWVCASLYRLNVEFDIISSSEEHLEDYSFIVIPALYSAAEKDLLRIRQYVAMGGHILVTFRSGFCDEHLKIYHDTQPHILSECLGISYDQFTVPKETSLHSLLTPSLPDAEACIWMELVTPTTAQTVLSYIHPYWNRYAAATMHSYGAGTGAYLAAYFTDETFMDEFMKNCLGQADIVPSEITYPVIIKRGHNSFGKEILCYLNYSNEPQEVPCRTSRSVNLLTGCRINQGDILTLKPWDLMILEG